MSMKASQQVWEKGYLVGLNTVKTISVFFFKTNSKDTLGGEFGVHAYLAELSCLLAEKQ